MGGAISDMHSSFQMFGLGLILAIVLCIILMRQFASFSDFIILLAIDFGRDPILMVRHDGSTSCRYGVVMMTGIAASDSILIVEFVGTLRANGRPLKQALAEAAKCVCVPF